MKKFSRSAAAGLVAVAALSLSACHPPHQQPSDEKVANAATYTGAPKPGVGSESASQSPAAPNEDRSAEDHSNEAEPAANGEPMFQDCVATPAVEPHTVTLNCADDSDRIEEIDWKAWESDSARGTGTRVVTENGREQRTENAEIELHNPTDTADGLAFTEIIVDGQPVEQ